MNIGIFTDTFEPQINGVVTSIKTSMDYLEKKHNICVFCPNVKPKVESTDKVWRFHQLFTHFKRNIVLFYHLIKNWTNKKVELGFDSYTRRSLWKYWNKSREKIRCPHYSYLSYFFEKYLHYLILQESWVYKYAKKESERFCNLCDKIMVQPMR